MSESPVFQVILLIFLGVGSFLLLIPFSSHLVYRLALICLLGAGGWFLYPALAIIPGILAIPADYIFLLGTDGSVTAFEPLMWAVFLLVPYLAALGCRKHMKNKETDIDSPDKKNINFSSGEQKDPLPFPEDSPGDEDPTYRLQKLVTGFFERAQKSLGFSNLFYFHVHSTRAIPGYLINGAGEIDEDMEFTPDVGQGVGWVLRHGERLTLPQNQIDWRNLQYHRQPVDLKRVIIDPVEQKGDLIGIIALEWAEEADVGREDLDDFFDLVRELFILDLNVRRLAKNQDQLQVMENLYDINPLEEKEYSRIVRKVLNRVGEFIPARKVGFYQFTEEAVEEVAPPARRKLYQQCLDWLARSGEILKISNVKNETLAGKPLDRHDQTEVGSLLAGQVEGEENKIGALILEHPETGYFQEEEKRLLEILLKYFSQTLTVAEHFRQLEADKKKQFELLGVVDDLSLTDEIEEFSGELTERFIKKLQIQGVAFYWRNKEGYSLVTNNGSIDPPNVIDFDNTLVKRIKNSGENGRLLVFPEASRLEDYEVAVGIKTLYVAPVFTENKLRGIFVFFSEKSEEIDEETRLALRRALSVICDRYQLIYRNNSWKSRALTDTATGLPKFKKWKRHLARAVEGEPEYLTGWHLIIPGYERICREEEHKKISGWLKSIARLLNDYFPRARVCRPYGTVFYGFNCLQKSQVQEELDKVKKRMEKLNYPLGSWPEEPDYKISAFSPPYPEVNKIVRAPSYGQKESTEKK